MTGPSYERPTGGAPEEILVVEDEQIVALDIRSHLERFGYSVGGTLARAEDAIEFLETRAHEQRLPDLVLMDISLQGEMDGVTASGIIRSQFSLPVILLTAFTDEETFDRARMSAPFAYIVKPFEARELRSAVGLALYRNRMERAVRSREQLLSGILSSIEQAVIVSDQDGMVAFSNEMVAPLLGAEVTEQRRLDELIPVELQARAKAARGPVEWIRHHERGEMANTVHHSNGPATPAVDMSDDERILELRAHPLTGVVEPRRLDYVWVIAEVTEQVRQQRILKRTEQHLARAERMEAVGRMSGGLAHDFNNLVTVIMGYTRLALDDLAAMEGLDHVTRNVQGIYDTARRSATLTRQLLTFSRVQQLKREPVQIDSIVEEAREMILGIVPEYVTLQFHLHAGVTTIEIDRGQLEQVIINLVLNARDAMPRGGYITVSTETITVPERLSLLTGWLPPGDYVRLRVADTGNGIAAHDIDHIFEPFFSTKETAHGTGLGLATVYSSVMSAEGGIGVSSTLGVGTTFSVYLPQRGIRAEMPPEAGAVLPDVRGSERILVVQDEEAMRTLIATVLRERGFVPIVARSVGDALLVMEHEEHLAAVITNLSAPYLEPAQIVQRFRSHAPDRRVAVILTISDDTGVFGQDATIRIPFEPYDLLHTVRAAIDNAPDALG